MREIDGKKRDGRLGKIARRFNNLVVSVAQGGPPITIQESNPKVLLGLSQPNKIIWESNETLDPDEPDHKIVAEAIYAKELPDTSRMLVSHDIQPILAANGAGLQTHRISDDWLRPTEPSQQDRHIQRLKQQVRNYEKSEPSFKIDIQLIESSNLSLVKLESIEDSERRKLQSQIISKNPQKNQHSGGLFPMGGRHDHDLYYGDRYKKWRDERIPKFMQDYEQKIAMAHNQLWYAIKIKNNGEVQANSLRVDISLNHGWFNEKPVLITAQGPFPPSPKSRLHQLHNFANMNNIINKTPRHEFALEASPSQSKSITAFCEDFRHGHSWTLKGVLGIDAYKNSPTMIDVAVTAANFHGTAKEKKIIDWTVEKVTLNELVDLKELRLKRTTIVDPLLDAGRYDDIDFNRDDED
jgi:hypothetical protein